MKNKFLIIFGILFIFLSINFVTSAYYYYNGTAIASSDFYATWNTSKTGTGSSNATTISLPLYNGGNYNFSVDWGDGAITSVTAYNNITANHTYTTAKLYNITLSGDISGFRFNNTGDRLKIINIRQWGGLNLGNNKGYFYGCSNLNITAIDSPNLTGTTDLTNMFYSASVLSSNISSWNVSGVNNTNSMFRSASIFNSDLSGWDVSNIVIMSSMFRSASKFNQVLTTWNTSNVILMDNMFNSASIFNKNISTWNTHNVTKMGSMFNGATAFNQNLSNWNTLKVNDMSSMFYSATNFNGNISNWNTSSVTNMNNMFYSASKFNQSLNWDTSKVTNMYRMFYLASKFNGNISNWNTSSVTSMVEMFYGAVIFNQGLPWDTGKVTNMTKMFAGATIFNGNISKWNTSSVTSMNGMFIGPTVFNQDIGNWDTSKVTSMNNMFYYDSSFNQNLSNWNTSNVTDMSSMFRESPFNGNISTWDVSKVTTMGNMFKDDYSFNQDIGNWDTSKVTSMNNMFDTDISFNQNLGNWNTSSVTNMNSMFYGATAFNQNLSNWDTRNVNNMGSMFYYATNFNGNVSNWDVSKVTAMNSMFYYDSSFNQNLGNWNISNYSNIQNMNFFLSGTNLSVQNYNNLLIGWANLSSLKTLITLGANNLKYSAIAITSRNILINNWNWTVLDDGRYYYPSIDIISPTNLAPILVRDGLITTITFLALGDGTLNFTTGALLNDIFIGGLKANVVNAFYNYSYLEGFEDLTFPQGNFTLSGNVNWTRNISNPLVGIASARSGVIGNNQVSKLTLILSDFPANVQWDWNVSSENEWDSLCFLEDSTDCGTSAGGVCLGDGSTIKINTNSSNKGRAITGEMQEHASWNITSGGVHNLTWCYSKDAGSSGGTDSGWVDNITLNGIAIEQYGYIPGIGWQVNVTAPSGLNGLQDLFINVSYLGEVVNDTETSAINYDNTKPTINFTSPTPENDTTLHSNDFIVNFTGTEVNFQAGWVEINGINHAATCSGTAPYYCYHYFSGIVDGNYNVTALVNDSVGNVNSTKRYFIIYNPQQGGSGVGSSSSVNCYINNGNNCTLMGSFLLYCPTNSMNYSSCQASLNKTIVSENVTSNKTTINLTPLNDIKNNLNKYITFPFLFILGLFIIVFLVFKFKKR